MPSLSVKKRQRASNEAGSTPPCAILAAVSTETPSTPERSDFIREIVAADLREGRHQTIVTRFPPEPNGYLHIGHAQSICLNFGIALENGGRYNLRFDDTNPMKEEQKYIDAIEADIRWLGFDWGEHLYFASDYFEQLYEWAVDLIRAGKAYVDDLSADEIREHRGTFTEPGRESPWRDRPAEESLDLFARMRAGEFPDGARVLRARIDMAAAQHQPARPGPVPDPPRGASAHRRRLVRLPDLRLRPRAVRRDRGHHALHLHPRVRGPPAALRLAHRQPAGAVAPAPVSSSRGSTSRTPSSRSASFCASSTRATCAAGTTPACPRSRACAGGASPPRGSATS